MNTRAAAVLTAIWPLTGCAGIVEVDFGRDRIVGSGHVATEIRSVHGFDGVVMSGVGHVVVEVTGHESLEVTAEDNVLRYLESFVSDGRLHLRIRNGIELDLNHPIEFRITVRRLRDFTMSGAGTGELYGVDERRFRVDMSGASRLYAEGVSDVQEVHLSGASFYEAPALETLETVVHASGASSAIVWTHDYLEVHGSGASNVRYRGRPEIAAQLSGASTVTRY